MHIEAGDNSVKYAALSDGAITSVIKEDAIKSKDYYIYPGQLFADGQFLKSSTLVVIL